MTFMFKITVHPVLQLGKCTGMHTILFTPSLLGDQRLLEDCQTAQVKDDTIRKIIAGDVEAVTISTHIAFDLCSNMTLPYAATVEDIASVASEIRKRSTDAVQVYRKAVAGYPI